MTAFFIITSIYLVFYLLNTSWALDIILPRLGCHENHDALAFFLCSFYLASLVALIPFTLALIGFWRKKQRGWNMAALLLSLPSLLLPLLILNGLLEKLF